MQQSVTRQLTIGRGKTNDIIIPNPDISRQHAVITFITDHVFLLEDKGSLHGSTVNGQRVDRKIIGMEDTVVLAGLEPIDLTLIQSKFGENASPKTHSSIPKSPGDYREEFRKLEKMFEMYAQVSEALLINTPRHQAWLRATFSITPLLGFAFGPFGMAFGVMGSVIGQILSAELINPSEKKLTLEKEFKRTYVCPNPDCKRFLGFTPYADLVYQKACSRCKCKWTD